MRTKDPADNDPETTDPNQGEPIEEMHYCGNPKPEDPDDYPEDLYVSRFSPPYCPRARQ